MIYAGDGFRAVTLSTSDPHAGKMEVAGLLRVAFDTFDPLVEPELPVGIRHICSAVQPVASGVQSGAGLEYRPACQWQPRTGLGLPPFIIPGTHLMSAVLVDRRRESVLGPDLWG